MSTPARNAQTAALEAFIEADTIELKLPTVRRRFRALAAESLREQQTPVAYLGALLEAEMAERAERREKRRLIDARFPQIKRLEDYRFKDNPKVPQGTTLKGSASLPSNWASMSYTDAIARVGQIQTEIASIQNAFSPAAAAAAQASTQGTSGSGSATTDFASALAAAQSPTQSGVGAVTSPTGGVALTGQSAPLPASAATLLTSGQQQYAARLAGDTGLSSSVVTAWLLSEESGGAATSRQSSNNNDWLNIGYTDSATYGSADAVWSDPIAAADATAGWLKGQNTIPGYGTASSGIQSILQSAGQSPAAQVAAIQGSGWASSGYPGLPSLLQQVG
jgi:hypothetical protein